jgi:hypothetical protein
VNDGYAVAAAAGGGSAAAEAGSGDYDPPPAAGPQLLRSSSLVEREAAWAQVSDKVDAMQLRSSMARGSLSLQRSALEDLRAAALAAASATGDTSLVHACEVIVWAFTGGLEKGRFL